MPLSFEDWLKEKHPEIDAEEWEKLIQETNTLMNVLIEKFAFSSPKVLSGLAVLVAEKPESVQQLLGEYFINTGMGLVKGMPGSNVH